MLVILASLESMSTRKIKNLIKKLILFVLIEVNLYNFYYNFLKKEQN